MEFMFNCFTKGSLQNLSDTPFMTKVFLVISFSFSGIILLVQRRFLQDIYNYEFDIRQSLITIGRRHIHLHNNIFHDQPCSFLFQVNYFMS